MKTKIAVIILIVACAGLGIAYLMLKKHAEEQQGKDAATISNLSGQVMTAQEQIDKIGQVNLTYSNELMATRQQLTLSGRQLAELSNNLTTASVTLAETRASLNKAQVHITDLTNHVSDLVAQNTALNQRTSELTKTIAQLNSTIADTQKQLAVAVTNRVFLEQELQKQMAKRAELEHQFNDLTAVRTQVRKLRAEEYVARRIELAKNDTSGKKGAELLIERAIQRAVPAAANPTTSHPPNYDLNVEVGSDGSLKVIPAPGATNNAPAAR